MQSESGDKKLTSTNRIPHRHNVRNDDVHYNGDNCMIELGQEQIQVLGQEREQGRGQELLRVIGRRRGESVPAFRTLLVRGLV